MDRMASITAFTRSSATAITVLIGLPFAIGAAALTVAPINPDTAYAMVVGRRLLAGDRLYVDMLETNPPLFYWLMSLPALLSREVQIRDDRLVGLFAAAVLLIVGLSAIRILRLEPRPTPWLIAGTVGAFVAALTIPFMAWAGQREQIAAMLTFPYVLLAGRTAMDGDTPRGDRLWCGLLAGAGFSIKPVLSVRLGGDRGAVVLWRGFRAAIRAESVVVALTQGAYGIAIAWFTSDYVTRIVPIALARYWAYGTTVGAILRQPRFIVLAGVGVMTIVLPFLLHSRSAAARYSSIMGAATLGWLVGYAAQSKGWYYHYLPAAAYGAAACASAGVALAENIRHSRARTPWRLAATIAVLIASLGVATYLSPRLWRATRSAVATVREPYPAAVNAMAQVIEERAVGEPIYLLSTALWPAFPLVNLAGSTWPYRYHFLWPLPALYRDGAPYRSSSTQPPLERDFFETVVTDLVRSPPRLLIVERGNLLQAMEGRPFDFVEYLFGVFGLQAPVRRVPANRPD